MPMNLTSYDSINDDDDIGNDKSECENVSYLIVIVCVDKSEI